MPTAPGLTIWWGPDGTGAGMNVANATTPLPVQLPAGSSASAVQGAGPAASPSVGYPVLMGGWNGTSTYTLKTDTSGQLLLGAAENHIGLTGGVIVNPTANFTRPADTTAYAANDLVANNTTAASVAPMQFAAARVSGGSGKIYRARLKKTNLTTTNATFRLHLYGADPSASSGIANGDNGAWSTKQASYLGSIIIDLTASTGRVFTDFSEGLGTPDTGTFIAFALASGTTVYGLLEARAAYTPASAEVFYVELEVEQN